MQRLRGADHPRRRQAAGAARSGDGRLQGALFRTPESRRPIHVFPREILASRPFLADVERRLPVLRDRPALIVWPTKEVAFRERERRRWETAFPDHRSRLIEGAGHYIQEDASDAIVAAVREWRPAPAG